ncbi:MAG: GTP-binding protein [Actinomycetota bacterium]|nr:GTP-binding protein [Actinomycetota bacterium]
MELLRLATAGSVDDGKSTLIGRLLYDSKGLFEDQLEAIERFSAQRGDEYLDLALVTDGLREERAQGITIDVAHRYFSTPARSFVIADTPGHVQYTRNMVTGASTADLAVVLVDVRKGLTDQTRRHALVVSLLRVPHLVLCVNKMDLVGYDRAAFEEVCEEFAAFARRLDVPDVTMIPVSALHGDNVVQRTVAMPWYEGTSLLYHLEHVYTGSDRNLIDARFPVQWVVRPRTAGDPDYRGYAGTVTGGVLRPGDEVVVLPSGLTTTITAIDRYDGPVDEAFPPMAVVLRLADDLDVARGDLVCRPHNRPVVGQDLEAMVCWMGDRPLRPGDMLALKHTTRWARCVVQSLRYRLEVHGLHRQESATELACNEIGRVRLRATQPVVYDTYHRNRETGSFILADEETWDTVAAGMLLAAD